jgi:hypothetical protein
MVDVVGSYFPAMYQLCTVYPMLIVNRRNGYPMEIGSANEDLPSRTSTIPNFLIPIPPSDELSIHDVNSRKVISVSASNVPTSPIKLCSTSRYLASLEPSNAHNDRHLINLPKCVSKFFRCHFLPCQLLLSSLRRYSRIVRATDLPFMTSLHLLLGRAT